MAKSGDFEAAAPLPLLQTVIMDIPLRRLKVAILKPPLPAATSPNCY